MRKLVTWYQNQVRRENIDIPKYDDEFMRCVLNIQLEMEHLEQKHNNKLKSLERKYSDTLQDAFAYACLLGLRKQLDNIKKYNFPEWLINSQLYRRMQWEAFFSLQPENPGQRRYQKLLCTYNITAYEIARVIDGIYDNVAEKAHPIDCLKFVENKTLDELVPKCSKLLDLQAVAPKSISEALKLILAPEEKGNVPSN